MPYILYLLWEVIYEGSIELCLKFSKSNIIFNNSHIHLPVMVS